MNKIKSILATVAAIAATACSSNETPVPENPEIPIGYEVPTEVIYEVNPRFFGENDCLKGVTAQLSRISDMGCDILWVMPVYETGELKGIGSPYCVRDYKAVNARYGTMADMKDLVDAAHAKGMKVILDWVANHTAWDCAWITEHPNWYKKDAGGNIIAPNGWNDVAQLDYNNSDMRAAMKDAMFYWVDRLSIDGFRCDYADGVPHDFWSSVISDLRASHPDMIMLAETSNSAYYADGFDMIYDWNSAPAISGAFKGGKPASVVSEATEALDKVPDGESILRYAFNHDVAAENNVATMYGTPEGVRAAYVLAAMFNGTPLIYSSMDVEGLSGELSFFGYRTLNFSTTLSEAYKTINAAFKASAEVRRGELRDYSNSSVVCFTRTIPEHTLLVAVNTTGSVQTVRTPIVLFDVAMTSLLDDKTSVLSREIELEPYAYTILMN